MDNHIGHLKNIYFYQYKKCLYLVIFFLNLINFNVKFKFFFKFRIYFNSIILNITSYLIFIIFIFSF